MQTANKKRLSTSLIIREIQIKTTVIYHFTPTLRWLNIKKKQGIKCWPRYREIGTPGTDGGKVKWSSVSQEVKKHRNYCMI